MCGKVWIFVRLIVDPYKDTKNDNSGGSNWKHARLWKKWNSTKTTTSKTITYIKHKIIVCPYPYPSSIHTRAIMRVAKSWALSDEQEHVREHEQEFHKPPTHQYRGDMFQVGLPEKKLISSWHCSMVDIEIKEESHHNCSYNGNQNPWDHKCMKKYK